ncbi:MAG: hypothetical protein K2Q22_16400, partial [Cytophagales bacterium]|nr:hypothetical protein [Cytophagales bacterium]
MEQDEMDIKSQFTEEWDKGGDDDLDEDGFSQKEGGWGDDEDLGFDDEGDDFGFDEGGIDEEDF